MMWSSRKKLVLTLPLVVGLILTAACQKKRAEDETMVDRARATFSACRQRLYPMGNEGACYQIAGNQICSVSQYSAGSCMNGNYAYNFQPYSAASVQAYFGSYLPRFPDAEIQIYISNLSYYSQGYYGQYF